MNFQTLCFLLFVGLKTCSGAQVCADCASEDTIFVHVMFRHGDRSPVSTFFSNDFDWPVDLGDLTNIGKKMHYDLGKWLHQRYRHIIGDKYSAGKIYVRSTDVDRTLESAMSNLAGMFPPKNDAVWNENIFWNPIPIHTVSRRKDIILPNYDPPPCALYEKSLNEVKQLKRFQDLNIKAKELYDFVTEQTGQKITNMDAAYIFLDAILIETFYNRTLPKWTKKVYPNNNVFKEIYDIFMSIFTYTPIMSKLQVGFLLREMLSRSLNKSQNTLKPNRSMWVYSAHDSNLASFLHALGMYNEHSERPSYASCIMFELHLIKKIPHIQIFFKNNNKVVHLTIPNCGQSCPLEKMFKLYANIIPLYDHETECNAKIY